MTGVPKQRLNRSGGFSMIELLVILVVLSLAAAVTIPSYKSFFRSMRLTKTAEDLAHYLRYGRTRALIRQEPVLLAVDRAGRTFRLQEARLNNDGETEFLPLRGQWGAFYRIPSDLELREGCPEIVRFSRDGSIGKAEFCLCASKECLSVRTGIVWGQAVMLRGCESE
ncbi:MAG TPA: prepilin-type N-terminal cleavage/methylation domain-containing protein [Candidatus Omnitrophota bacterium]|jgi:type II secretory pathway pseudopilin PulG|nr:prepilin-type N-terminal cleavage/methylation domain-containing protein [Candidatus Omnitrophota bacterium]HSA30606.1 prepilin-type N-terminal cleavage/methylation domain-containing protein [Candidatus Omnitrophota bacterium]